MFLFIFESIGTSELMLIGIVALMFLGPRKLPEIARKMGKIMNEFRATTNEFKSTWQREVNFEEEAAALRTGELADEHVIASPAAAQPDAPAIRSIDREAFDALAPKATDESREADSAAADSADDSDRLSDKRSWL